MHKTYQAKNFGIVCGKEKRVGAGETFFIFRSEIGSVTGGIRRHGRIYRFADAIFYRLGLCRSFSLGFRRREYPAVQFRGRAGDSGADGARPLLCLFAAASGNTLGGMTCYWIGHLGKRDWITRYLRVEPAKIDRVSRFLEGKGPCSLFSPFCPMSAKRRHRTRPDAQQCLDYGRCDVRRQNCSVTWRLWLLCRECFRGFEAVGCRNLRAARRTAYILLRRE